MKKIISVILSLSLTLSLMTGCGSTKNGSENSSTNNEREFVQVHGDKQVFYNISDLVKAADLIIIGEYIEDTKQELEYKYSAEFGKDIFDNATSTNTILVKKLLKGDITDKTLPISQRYGVLEDTNQLIAFSELTPMEKGQQWIFFLFYDDINNTYWVSGDYTGRYPVPDDKLISICDAVSDLRNKRSEWLQTRKKVSDSKVEEKLQNNDTVYTDSDWSNYALDSDDVETLRSYDIQIQSYREKIDPAEFGVYDKNNINIELYCDVLEMFDLK